MSGRFHAESFQRKKAVENRFQGLTWLVPFFPTLAALHPGLGDTRIRHCPTSHGLSIKIASAICQVVKTRNRHLHDYEHLLLNTERADYGAKLFKQLAADTRIDKRTLYQCAQFYRFFPIVSTCSQLGWGHDRLLCQVADATQRSRLQASAAKNKWTCQELAERVRPLNAAVNLISDSNGANDNQPAARLLTPKRGTVGLYRVIARDDVFINNALLERCLAERKEA